MNIAFIKNLLIVLALLTLFQGCRKSDERALQAPQHEIVEFIVEEIGGAKRIFQEDTSNWTSGSIRLDHTASLDGESYTVRIRYLGSKPQFDMYGIELSGTVFGGHTYTVRDISPLEEIFPDGLPVSPGDKISVRIKVRKKKPNQPLQTTNRTVTECAPSRTFRASCGHV
jgi:hypothetical protein